MLTRHAFVIHRLSLTGVVGHAMLACKLGCEIQARSLAASLNTTTPPTMIPDLKKTASLEWDLG